MLHRDEEFSGLEGDAKVNKIVMNDHWLWPAQSSSTVTFIMAITPADFKPNQEQKDYVWWQPKTKGR